MPVAVSPEGGRPGAGTVAVPDSIPGWAPPGPWYPGAGLPGRPRPCRNFPEVAVGRTRPSQPDEASLRRRQEAASGVEPADGGPLRASGRAATGIASGRTQPEESPCTP